MFKFKNKKEKYVFLGKEFYEHYNYAGTIRSCNYKYVLLEDVKNFSCLRMISPELGKSIHKTSFFDENNIEICENESSFNIEEKTITLYNISKR